MELSYRHYHRRLSWYCIEGRFVDIQMRLDQFRRRVSQPLRERKVLKAIGFEHLQEHQIGVACVFDVVQQGLFRPPYVSLLKVPTHLARFAKIPPTTAALPRRRSWELHRRSPYRCAGVP